MATRVCFIVSNDNKFFVEDEIDFQFYNGFALSQKQKSISSLHNAIIGKYPGSNILEVSRKSPNTIGNKLSAFNLTIFNDEHKKNIPVECVFQSSKVFENGNQYKDLLLVPPIDAKKYEPLKHSGKIIGFKYGNFEYPNSPRTLFYDWIYINALKENPEILNELSEYDIFTDIEFNQNKSINCQARSCAIAVSLYNQKLLDEYLSNIDLFKKVYDASLKQDVSLEQISLF